MPLDYQLCFISDYYILLRKEIALNEYFYDFETDTYIYPKNEDLQVLKRYKDEELEASYCIIRKKIEKAFLKNLIHEELEESNKTVAASRLAAKELVDQVCNTLYLLYLTRFY